MEQHLIIKASAGSGKTFQLSNRYLSLLFEDVRPEQILATTFTRKAAGEILDRVLLRLAKGALDPEGAAELSQAIYGDPFRLSQERVLERLAILASNLHLLRISTLDSFFSSLVGNFAPELGFPVNWRIVDTPAGDQIRNQAILSVLSEPKKNNTIELIHLLFKGESRRSLSKELAELVKDLLGLYRETKKEAWNTIPFQQCLNQEEMDELVSRISAAPFPMNKKGQPNGNALKGIKSTLENYRTKERDSISNSSLITNILNGNNYYYAALSDEMTEQMKFLITDIQHYFLNKISKWTEATCDIISRISQADDDIRKISGEYEIGDFSRFLALYGKRLEVEQTNYRLDTKTTHLLLDEFQDTSLQQWQILQPIAESITDGYSLPSEKSFFCVGDLKQSIYSWRGGVSEIFNEVETSLRVPVQNLDKNWRSSPIILDAVNEFFSAIGSNPVLAPKPEDKKCNDTVRNRAFLNAAMEWQKGFHTHTAARTAVPGFVSLESAPLYQEGMDASNILPLSDEGEDDKSKDSENVSNQTALSLSYAVRRIAELHIQRPQASIGVLVRKNNTVGSITAGLARLGIEASQEGGVPLSTAQSVRAVLGLLRLADHPGDSAAKFRVATFPQLSERFGMTLDRIHDKVFSAALSHQIRDRIMTCGLGTFVRETALLLFPFCGTKEAKKLHALTEQAFKFEQEGELRIDRFIETAEKTKLKLPTASNIHIMTYHSSKGLEFDIVVLPWLEDDLVTFKERVILHRPSPTKPADAVLRWENMNRFSLLPERFQKAAAEKMKAMMTEALNTLYVAMTRAVYELVMIVSPNEKGSYTGIKASNMLRAHFTNLGTANFPETPGIGEEILYTHGDPRWYENLLWNSPESEEESSSFLSFRGIRTQISPFRVLSSSRTPSDKGFRRVWQNSSAAFDRGTAIHACFERIEWLDGKGKPNRDELRHFLEQQFYSGISAEEILDEFDKALSFPSVTRILSKESYVSGTETPVHAGNASDPHWEIFPERPFLVPSKEGKEYTKGRIDRLVVLTDGDRAVGADIIDFKTDRNVPRPGTPEWEGYAHQLQEYRKGVMRLYNLSSKQVSARLLFVFSGDVIAPAEK